MLEMLRMILDTSLAMQWSAASRYKGRKRREFRVTSMDFFEVQQMRHNPLIAPRMSECFLCKELCKQTILHRQ